MRAAFKLLMIVCFISDSGYLVAQRPIDSRLIVAARTGDAAGVQSALAAGANASAADSAGASPLFWAAHAGSVSALQILLDAGAEPGREGVIWIDRKAGRFYGSPLAAAAGRGHLPVIRFLIERAEFDVNQPEWHPQTRSHSGWTPLQWAAVEGEADIVAYLLSRGASPSADATGGGPASVLAAAMGHMEVLRLLLCTTGIGTDRTAEIDRIAESLHRADHIGLSFALERGPGAACELLSDQRRLARLHAADSLFLPVSDIILSNGPGGLASMDDSTVARFREALPIYAAEWGEGHPLHVTFLSMWGSLARQRGEFGQAQEAFARVLRLRETQPKSDPGEVVQALVDLGYVLMRQGNYAAARPLYERAIDILNKTEGSSSATVAAQLNSLAATVEAHGDHEFAIPLFRRVLELVEALPNVRPRDLSTVVGNLGVSLRNGAHLEEAGRQFQRAILILESSANPDSSLLATHLSNLGGVYRAQNQLQEAQGLYQRALKILTQIGNEQERALVLGNLGVVLLQLGQDSAALPLFEEALVQTEDVVGMFHQSLVEPLFNLAGIHLRQHRAVAARTLIFRGSSILTGHTRDVLPLLAPAQQRLLVQQLQFTQSISLLLDLCGQDSASCAEAYAHLADHKGLLLHELRRQTLIARLGSDTAYAPEVSALQHLRSSIASLQDAGAMQASGRRAVVDSLTREKERLERRLAAVLPRSVLDDPWTAMGLSGLQAGLPGDAAFVDVYLHGRQGVGGDAIGWYSAVVITRNGAPRVVELAMVAVLDSLRARWQEEIVAGLDGAATAYNLIELAWAPIAEALPPGVRRLWVSPDYQLARVPWNYFAEQYAGTDSLFVAQVPSPRALARLLAPSPRVDGRDVLLVGDIDFGDPADGRRWPVLPESKNEIEQIAQLARAAHLTPAVLVQREPTPSAVAAALERSQFAHLATHGFFSRDGVATHAVRPQVEGDREATPASSRNALVESGVVLAGANAGAAGTLTAEELLGLDLSGSRLVVLSACDTGLGGEVTGQGVMGLRASIGAAGARTMLLSIWKVPDPSTAMLMTEFYRGIWEQGLDPSTALRSAQAVVRSDPRFTAPLFWAAWVLDGDAWQNPGPNTGVSP
jgi:tetratricopeptide (TPR) repeat protein